MPWKDRYTTSDEVGLADEDVHWPDGQRCAFTVVVNLSVAQGPEGIVGSDLQTPAAYLGWHQGLDELLRVLAKHDINATFAVPAVMAEIFPDRIKSLRADGHEIAALGFKHEDVSQLEPDEEKARLERTIEILCKTAGERPTGWFGLPRPGDEYAVGTLSPHTLDLLIDNGFDYFGNGLADDIPYYWATEVSPPRSILALPYYYHFDDQYFCLYPSAGTGLETSDMLARNWHAEFKAQYKRGRHFTMTLHPAHSGWCNRMALLDAFLAEAMSFSDVWNATGSACASYWRNAYPASEFLRLEPSVWKDYPGSLS